MTDLKYEFDPLQMYFGEPYVIPSEVANDITIYEPTIGDILTFGERKFYSALNVFVTNPTSNRVMLWDNGLDWNKLSDYDLFLLLYKSLKDGVARLLFGDIDFTKFEICKTVSEDEESFILYNQEQNYVIDEKVYNTMSAYLRTMFNIFPKVEKAKGKTTKEWIIMEEREKLDREKVKDYKSNLLPLISACVNHPGFKYKTSELKEVHIMEFMDSVQRLQVYESTTALLQGRFSGMIDTSKIDDKEFNFMRDIYTK